MEQLIRTYHRYTDDTVNKDIREMARDGWTVGDIKHSVQDFNDKLVACILILFERESTTDTRTP